MHFALLTLVASVGFATAQSTACAAQTIVDTCLGTEKAQLDACPANDWACMCAAQQNVVTCYNNCPGDPLRSTANNVLIQYCGAASQASYYSSQSVAQMKQTASGSDGATLLATLTPTILAQTTTDTGTSTRSTTVSSTGAANAMIAPAGGLMAVAGLFAGLL